MSGSSYDHSLSESGQFRFYFVNVSQSQNGAYSCRTSSLDKVVSFCLLMWVTVVPGLVSGFSFTMFFFVKILIFPSFILDFFLGWICLICFPIPKLMCRSRATREWLYCFCLPTEYSDRSSFCGLDGPYLHCYLFILFYFGMNGLLLLVLFLLPPSAFIL